MALHREEGQAVGKKERDEIEFLDWVWTQSQFDGVAMNLAGRIWAW